MELNDNSFVQVNKGLNTDFNPLNQPKGTYRYAVNAVLESEDGNFLQISNEAGNVQVFEIGKGFKCVGSIYIDDGEVILFLTRLNEHNELEGEIGVYDIKTNVYTKYFNDKYSGVKFNFLEEHKIQATYRLRRGCEKVVYWVDGINPNRVVNITKYGSYFNNGIFNVSDFSIQRKYKKVPTVENLEIFDNAGNLPNGSLTILFQYLDEEKNGTKWLAEIPNINIYTDNYEGDYSDIDGSINNHNVEGFDNNYSSKAIKITYGNFDTYQKFYRLAFIHYYTNSKKPTVCYLSNVLSIEQNEFTYTGNNYAEKTTYEELMLFNNSNDVGASKTITQKDNRLLLGNSNNNNVNWGVLQRVASKIGVDCVVKKVKLQDAKDIHNAKNPFVHYFGSGFMPLEIYSFGIVWVFSDLTESPVYHIPGRAVRESGFYDVYTKPEDRDIDLDYFPMSPNTYVNNNLTLYNTNNTLKYIQKDSCNDSQFWNGGDYHWTRDEKFDYWSKDIDGNSLLNKSVRFHRFPSKQGLNLVDINTDEYTYILGVAFSNVELLGDEDRYLKSVGKEVIGYYFVKQEVKNRTILDSGYLIDLHQYRDYSCVSAPYSQFNFTLSSAGDNNYYGDVKVDKKTKMLLSPSGLFESKTFDDFTHIVEAGRVTRKTSSRTGFLIQNVSNVKSDDIDKESVETKQNDGADLKAIIKDITLAKVVYGYSGFGRGVFIRREGSYVHKLNPYEKANINSLNKTIYNMDGMTTNIYITGDLNSTIEDNKNVIDVSDYTIPYVYIIKSNEDFYNDFRTAPYYRITDTINIDRAEVHDGYTYIDDNYPQYTNQGSYYKSTISFKGDSYICGYRHTMSTYCGTAPKKPIKDNSSSISFWGIVLGVLAVVVTAVTFGVGLALVGGLLMLGRTIFYGIRSKISADEFNKRYTEDWSNGLEYLFQDNFFVKCFINPTGGPERLGYQDDTLRFYNYIIGDFIFETPVNIALRIEPNNDDTNYLRPFTPHQPPNNKTDFKRVNDTFPSINALTEHDLWKSWLMGVPIETKEEIFFLNKLCERDLSKKERIKKIAGYDRDVENRSANDIHMGHLEISGYKAYGSAKPVFYCINQDYLINENITRNYTIPFEYSFCTKCSESFPHRIHWSDVSFAEQLTDNYRIFKPNDYKDLNGENGSISNLFVMNNQLYIHTTNGLWIQPTNYQERISNGIVSYIGTGEFGSLPAQLIVNNKTGTSAGLNHFTHSVLTHKGYFFVSLSDSKIYWFNGQLNCISDLGMSKWFADRLDSRDMNLRLNYDFVNDRLLVSHLRYDGWTLSFNTKTNSWISFHTYLPEEYIQIEDKMLTYKKSKLYLHTHNVGNIKYQTFYDRLYPFIVEYVDNGNTVTNRIFDHIKFSTQALKYINSSENKGFVEQPLITFNKALLYNSYQNTNILNLVVKDLFDYNSYLPKQIENTGSNILLGTQAILDKNEKDWCLNDFRDAITDYTKNMFNTVVIDSLNNTELLEYIPDKILNYEIFSGEKQWYDLSSLRDKYLVVRLIFDNFADVKLIFNFASEYNTVSQY